MISPKKEPQFSCRPGRNNLHLLRACKTMVENHRFMEYIWIYLLACLLSWRRGKTETYPSTCLPIIPNKDQTRDWKNVLSPLISISFSSLHFSSLYPSSLPVHPPPSPLSSPSMVGVGRHRSLLPFSESYQTTSVPAPSMAATSFFFPAK